MDNETLKKLFSETPGERRAQFTKLKRDATWLAFTELNGLLNVSQIARHYFHKSTGWLSQRIYNYEVRGKKMFFKEQEYHQLAEAFRHIAQRLEAHADEIDAAAMETDD